MVDALRSTDLRTFVHDIPLAVAMVDRELRIVSYSEAWRELLAYDGPALEGEPYAHTFEPRIALAEPMSAAMGGLGTQRREAVALQTFASTERIVDVEVRPWSMPSGETGGAVALLHDVTAATLARRELQRVNGELREFNYRVSHDLLSPLKTMRGFIELCEEELRDGNVEVVAGYHEIMRQNVLRLGTLVENVLDLARVDVRDVEQTDVELGALVDEIFRKHRPSAEQASIRVSHACEGLRLCSQRARVWQVLEQLVSNAIKYHHPDREERRVSVTGRADAGGGVVLVVRDNGIGFDESQSSAIFDSFRRATSKHPGSGLGLYIVEKHLERLGGSVRVVSSRDDTIFEVSIPSGRRP